MNAKLRVVLAHVANETRKSLCEFLKEYNYEILELTFSGQRAADVIIKEKPDVVITDVYLHDLDALGMYEKIRSSGYGAKTVFVVASTVGAGSVIDSLYQSGMDMYVLIPFDNKYVDDKIREIHKQKRVGNKSKPLIISQERDEFDVLTYVADLMHEVGVPASIRGYDYIRESIVMALSDKQILKAITKELYPSIAKNNATTASRVERAIRHAVEVAWQRGDVDVLNAIFGYTVKSTKGKPTNGEFISMLTERVRLGLKIS